MAKINFFLGDIKGKMAGLVFQGGPAGSILRRKSVPVDPDTPVQTLQRERFGGLSRVWAYDLTQVQRDGWDSLAVGVTVPDSFGNPVDMTGKMLHQSLNSNKLLVGETALADAPDDLNVRALVSAETDVMEHGLSHVTLEIADVCTATERFVIYGVVNLSPALQYVSSLYVLCAVSPLSQVQSFDVYYPAKFGACIGGKKNSFRCCRYNSLNGVMSSGIVCEGIIEAAP